MISSPDFPRLTEQNHRITSSASAEYNCIAWAVGDSAHWWQPRVYWPIEAPRGDYGIGILEQAFVSLGFEECVDGGLEENYEKIALYGWSRFYTHASRQLPDGKWSSKLGKSEDIEHDAPDDVAEGVYGEIVQFMKRPRPREDDNQTP